MDFNKLQLIAEEIDKYAFSNDKNSLENKLIELEKLNFEDSSLQSITYYFIGNIWSSLRRINHIGENSNIWKIDAYIGVFGQQCRSSTGHFCNEIF